MYYEEIQELRDIMIEELSTNEFISSWQVKYKLSG